MARNASPREVADRLHSAAIHLLRRVRSTDVQTGVTPAQLSALSVLMSGPKTLGELAAAEQVRPPTVTRLAQDLERLGLVRRESDKDDARVARLRSSSAWSRAAIAAKMSTSASLIDGS